MRMYVVCLCVTVHMSLTGCILIKVVKKLIKKNTNERCTSRLAVITGSVCVRCSSSGSGPNALHHMGARLAPIDCRPNLKRT